MDIGHPMSIEWHHLTWCMTGRFSKLNEVIHQCDRLTAGTRVAVANPISDPDLLTGRVSTNQISIRAEPLALDLDGAMMDIDREYQGVATDWADGYGDCLPYSAWMK